jgi:UDP-2,3-diacylglucosamine pyrophosphatase LpxH
VEGVVRGVDTLQRRVTRAVGRGEWSGMEDAILWTNEMIRKFDRFEERLSQLAVASGADGVICGHFHEPALRRDFGAIYANCGDWSSNCTAIVEGQDGHLRLLTHCGTVADWLLEEDAGSEAAQSGQALAL